ncbi:hypothetical protein, partial [Mycobacterium pseudokansasii]|uniref:hypothetical protein n=1 Tax=Mycobacterium pseudokansasii TaxID=2341080 RepID=UPI003CC7EC18
HQRSAICPSRQRLTFPACSRHTEIIDSMQFVERSVRASVGGTIPGVGGGGGGPGGGGGCIGNICGGYP